MLSVKINNKLFISRTSYLYSQVNHPIIVLLGKLPIKNEFNISSAIFTYVFGYEFPDSILVIDQSGCQIYTSPKKAVMVERIQGLEVIVKNKDGSNTDEILSRLSGKRYGLLLPLETGHFLERLDTFDVSSAVRKALLSIDAEGVSMMRSSANASNYLLSKGITMILDKEFDVEALEDHTNDPIRDVESDNIELAFKPEYSDSHLRIWVRYQGFHTEVAREFYCDTSEEFEIQNRFLGIFRETAKSTEILERLRGSTVRTVNLYATGTFHKLVDFSEDFDLSNNMFVVLNIEDKFCTTFLVSDGLLVPLIRDSAVDYSKEKMRFRNKTNDYETVSKIKEHQKELLDALLESQIDFYKNNKVEEKTETESSIAKYSSEDEVPRGVGVVLDWERSYVIVQVLSYSVPFHISLVKNVSIAAGRLRINFNRTVLDQARRNSSENTFIKSISVQVPDVSGMLASINSMKKEYLSPKIRVEESSGLKEREGRVVLPDMNFRSDLKMNTKKIVHGLELHENGIRYGQIVILFSNIKNVFLKKYDMENPSVLHFNLNEPISVTGTVVSANRMTKNIQFFRTSSVSYYDTGRNENDYNDAVQQELESELDLNHREILSFVRILEKETSIRVQEPIKGFVGVYAKEASPIMYTNSCMCSLVDSPFFVVKFSEIEVASFERVTFVTKTFDMVFLMKNKTVCSVNSIEMNKLGFLKELIDMKNIVFMETRVNINWGNLVSTILENPLSFYENGAWTELIREEKEAESEEINSNETEETEASTVGSTSSSESSVEESSSSYSSESESNEFVEDDYSSESSGRKRVKR